MRPLNGKLAEKPPLSRNAERALKVIYLEASIIRSSIIGPEHLWLSILRIDDEIAGQILSSVGIDLKTCMDLTLK